MRIEVVETPTQTLHRLTSFTWGWYEPSREDDDLVWSVPVEDPRVLRDLVPNDLDRLPWFFKRYADSLPRVALPRDLPATTAPAVAVLAGTAEVAPIDLVLPHLSRLLHLCAGVVRTTERPFTTWPFRAAGSAGGALPARGVRRRARRLGVARGRALVRPTRITRSCGSGRRHAATHPPSSSPASPGAPDGATASAGTGTSTGTPARCSRSCSRRPTLPGWRPDSTPASRTPRSPSSSRQTA